MRKFIYQTLLFLLLTITVVSSIYYYTLKINEKKVSFKIDSKYNQIILGHSHSECAFNDSIIPNIKNVSNSGESYFYTYPKLKKLVAQNKTIKTVFVEFSNNQISKELDSWIWCEKCISYRFPLYYFLLEKKDIEVLVDHNFDGVRKSFSILMRKNLKKIISKDYNELNEYGQFLPLKIAKTDSLLQNISKNTIKVYDYHDGYSIENVEYLKKIVAFCKEKSITLYFIRSPQHPKYIEKQNEVLFQKYLKTNFNDIEFLDFNTFPLKNDEYGDLDHLNYKGAKKFSIWFSTLLENGLLDSNNKQEFINNAIE